MSDFYGTLKDGQNGTRKQKKNRGGGVEGNNYYFDRLKTIIYKVYFHLNVWVREEGVRRIEVE